MACAGDDFVGLLLHGVSEEKDGKKDIKGEKDLVKYKNLNEWNLILSQYNKSWS